MPTEITLSPPPRYPAFGIPCGNPEKLHSGIDFFQKSIGYLSCAGVFLPVFFSTQIAIVGVLSILSVITLTALACIEIYVRATAHKRKLIFEDIQVPQAPIRLGQWTNNNDILVSNRVDESFQLKKAIIAQARKSLEISFNYGGGEAFRQTLSIIEQRMQLFPDLKVHILISDDVLGREDLRMLNNLKQRFSPRFQFVVTGLTPSINPRPHFGDNHCKMIIVDGKYFATGGSGIDDCMIRERPPQNTGLNTRTFRSMVVPDSFRDTDVFGKGELAPLMREQFFRLYHIWEYRSTRDHCNRFYETSGSETTCPEIDSSSRLIAGVRSKFLISGPEHRLDNPIVNELVKRVQRATHSIMLASPTFMPPQKLQEALLEKLRSRVSITGIFGGVTWQNYFATLAHTWPSRGHYNLLSEANESEVPRQFFHKKVCLFDNRYSMVGTFNISQKSTYWDYEDVLFFDDARVNQALREGLEEDRAVCRRISRERIESHYCGFFTRIKSCFAKNVVGHFTC